MLYPQCLVYSEKRRPVSLVIFKYNYRTSPFSKSWLWLRQSHLCLISQIAYLHIWLKFFRMGKIHEWCHFSSILVAVYSKYKQWYYQNKPTLLINGQIGVLGFKVFHLRWDNLWAMTGPKILWWTYGPIVLGLSQPINGSIWDGILWIPILQFVY